jgi:hypothetical protein
LDIGSSISRSQGLAKCKIRGAPGFHVQPGAPLSFDDAQRYALR